MVRVTFLSHSCPFPSQSSYIILHSLPFAGRTRMFETVTSIRVIYPERAECRNVTLTWVEWTSMREEFNINQCFPLFVYHCSLHPREWKRGLTNRNRGLVPFWIPDTKMYWDSCHYALSCHVYKVLLVVIVNKGICCIWNLSLRRIIGIGLTTVKRSRIGEVVKLLACGARGPSLDPGLGVMISEIGYISPAS